MNANPQTPSPSPVAPPDLHERIRRRAEEIYIRNGRIPFRDLENWAQAEKEIRSESASQPIAKKAIVIKVDGVQYVGEYDVETSDGYFPGEFGPHVRVLIRFDGDKMFVKRPNGKELETKIVKKVG